MVTHYCWEKNEPAKEVEFDLGAGSDGEWQIEVLDDEKTMEKQIVTVKDNKFVMTMKSDSVLFISKRG